MVSLKKKNGSLYFKGEYNTEFIKKAKRLGGRWDRSTNAWVFSEDRESFLLPVIYSIYGTIGAAPPVCVHVEIDMDLFYAKEDTAQQNRIGGFILAKRMSRDSEVLLPEWAFISEGEFCESGGSRNSPCVTWESGTKVRAKIPEVIYEKYKNHDGIRLAEEINREALQTERDYLAKRLAEVDAILIQ